MSLFITNPADILAFDSSSSGQKTQNLIVTNTSSSSIAYKVRTTASKSYLVKPNQGYLKVNESVPISITLQSVDSSSDPKHKFMIIGTASNNVEDINNWSNVPKDKTYDVKLDVVIGPGKKETGEVPRRTSVYSDSKGSIIDTVSAEELSGTVKKLEAEKMQLEAKLSQIQAELRNKEMKTRKIEVVTFKKNTLILFTITGLLFGFMYS